MYPQDPQRPADPKGPRHRPDPRTYYLWSIRNGVWTIAILLILTTIISVLVAILRSLPS